MLLRTIEQDHFKIRADSCPGNAELGGTYVWLLLIAKALVMKLVKLSYFYTGVSPRSPDAATHHGKANCSSPIDLLKFHAKLTAMFSTELIC